MVLAWPEGSYDDPSFPCLMDQAASLPGQGQEGHACPHPQSSLASLAAHRVSCSRAGWENSGLAPSILLTPLIARTPLHPQLCYVTGPGFSGSKTYGVPHLPQGSRASVRATQRSTPSPEASQGRPPGQA